MEAHVRTYEDDVAFLRKDVERRYVMHVGKGFVPNMNVAGELWLHEREVLSESVTPVCFISYTQVSTPRISNAHGDVQVLLRKLG